MARNRLGDLAHDMRQPLAVILANAEHLIGDERVQGVPGAIEILEEIRDAAKRMNAQISQLAAIAQSPA